jgi:Leucine-rich repeat (LRR) protein
MITNLYVRYLVVIDDVKMIHMENWDIVRNIFKGNGRVIVTTTIQSIANRCSSSENSSTDGTLGYVYKMRTLGDEDSRVIALQGRCSPEIVQGSAPLLKKCDGLPLALASVAKQLNSENEPTGQFCAELCRDLGYYLEREDEEEPNFARLRGVLMDNYTALPDYTVRTCLLYLSLFPTDCPLKRNVIIRRWMAEGYTRRDPVAGNMRVADVNFKTLVDRSIIHPAEPSQNATVKTCKTTGIMHAFMLHKSISKKFIMPFGAEQKKVRHLFIHGNNDTDSRSTLNTDLSCVRSLTVLGNAGDAISDFRKYKLIRVLDMEECTDLHDGHLKDICKLWNLRYLSLGPSISSIPMEIGRLQLLETLYVSKTKVNVLPRLIHLIGKFELQVAVPAKRKELPPQQLNIETLRGFVANGHQGFLQLIVHMKRLKKMKIWCEPKPMDHDPALLIVQMNNDLVDSILKYIEDPIEVGGSRALSIDFQALPEGSLYALGELCNQRLHSGKMYYLSSLKLHGNSSTLPTFIALFPDLTELHLSTNVTQEYLSVLSELPCLLYLKLVTDRTESFIIQAETFTSLRRMCFVFLETNPVLLTINNGSLPQLISLQLICEHLDGLSGIQTRYLRQLKEIVLHPAVGERTRKAWEAEAASHPNRPDVFPNRKVQT